MKEARLVGVITATTGLVGTVVEAVGTVAAGNPWEFFHKVAHGQPGSPMPSGLALGWSFEDIANLAAFAQTLPQE